MRTQPLWPVKIRTRDVVVVVARFYCFPLWLSLGLSSPTQSHVFALSVVSVSTHCAWFVTYWQGRTGSSNRPWLSRQIGPISSGIGTRASCTISKYSHPYLPPPSLSSSLWLCFSLPSLLPFYPSSVSWADLIKSIDLLPHLTWRPTWPVDQPAYLASVSSPLVPDSTLLSSK